MARTAGLQPDLAVGAAGEATEAPQEPRLEAAAAAAAKAVAQDRLFSCLALALWCIASTKSALASPLLAHHNLQSLTGAAAIFGVGLAWPYLAPRSYARWRVPALAALRILLMALPYNFEEGVWDEVFPSAATGHRLAWALNLSNLAVGTGIVMLVLTALGWRLPMRVHMLVQAVLVGLWMHFGVGPNCRSKLLNSPEMTAVVSALYQGFELAVAVLVPIAARPLGGPRTQAASVLLFGWLLVGWLLPTLLLLLPVTDTAPRARQQGRHNGRGSRTKDWLSKSAATAAWLESCLLASLHSLLASTPPPGPAQRDRRQQDDPVEGAQQHREACVGDLPPAMQLMLRWLTVLLLLWLPCRSVAPGYAGERAPLLASSS